MCRGWGVCFNGNKLIDEVDSVMLGSIGWAFGDGDTGLFFWLFGDWVSG